MNLIKTDTNKIPKLMCLTCKKEMNANYFWYGPDNNVLYNYSHDCRVNLGAETLDNLPQMVEIKE
jgi:hypothetical protein